MSPVTTRVSPPRISPEVALAPRPPMGAPGADAHRQASFVLGGELDLVLRGLALEGACAEASRVSRYRNQVAASAMAFWSRGWLCRVQALHAVQYGNYVAALPLANAAADCLTAVLTAFETGAAEWIAWLDGGAVALAPADHGMQFAPHHAPPADPVALPGPVVALRQAISILAGPAFAATLLLAGSESSPERVAMTFGDRDFHLALGELVLGWLARLSAFHLEGVLDHPDAFGMSDKAAARAWIAEAAALAAASDRCRLEPVERDGVTRYLVHNWRRQPGGAPRRILL